MENPIATTSENIVCCWAIIYRRFSRFPGLLWSGWSVIAGRYELGFETVADGSESEEASMARGPVVGVFQGVRDGRVGSEDENTLACSGWMRVWR